MNDVCPVMLLRCPSPPSCEAIGCTGDGREHPISEDLLTKEQVITLQRVERDVARLKAREGRTP